jgi:hypothetical protein
MADSPDSPAPETRPCPACGAENAAARNFCRSCGARLAPAAPPPASRRTARDKRKARNQLAWTLFLALLTGLLLWPAPGGERGDDTALDRASRKYLALAQAFAAGQGDSRSFTEAELNAFLAANARDGKNRPVAMSVRLDENGFSLVLPARPPFGASKCWTFSFKTKAELEKAAEEARKSFPGDAAFSVVPVELTGFSLGHLYVFPPLARTLFLTRTWPAWKSESREVVDFLKALDASTDGRTLVLSTR